MSKSDDINFDKLPNKVRLYIQRLERDLQEAQETLATFSDENAPVQVRRYVSNRPSIGFREHERVEFMLSNGRKIEVGLVENQNRLRVSTSGSLIVEPSATNSVYIHSDRY